MVKKKRKNKLDINQRKKTVNYQRKVTQESERFSNDIVKPKSKLKQNTKKSKPTNTSGLSSSKKSKKKYYQNKKSTDSKVTKTVDKKIPWNDDVAPKKSEMGQESLIKESKVRLTNKEQKRYFKTEKKLTSKQNKKRQSYNKPKYSKSSKVLKGASSASFVASQYISSGSNENVGVAAAEKGLRLNGVVTNYAQRKLVQKRRNPLKTERKFELKHKKNLAKSEYRSKLQRQPKDRLKKKSQYKKLIQKRQMKKKIYQQHNIPVGVKGHVKKQLNYLVKGSREFIQKHGKKLAFIMLSILVVIANINTMVGVILPGLTSANTEVLASSYLSDVSVLKGINEEFSSYEYSLQSELENIEQTYTGYDEYIIHNDEPIGHSVHELLSYMTAKYGEISSVSNASTILAGLFNKVYQVSYEPQEEVKYREVCTGEGVNKVCKQEEYKWTKMIATVTKKSIDTVAKENFANNEEGLLHYQTLLEAKGNMEEVFGSGSGDISEIIHNPDFSNPGIAYDDSSVKAIFNEAEKHIGKRYVFGGNGPANFDCSSFVCWSYTQSGIKNMPRTTAYQIYTNYCNPVSTSEAKAGDIIFFQGTYAAGEPISHVGIYAGNGYMLHAGDPIQYTSINQPYWQQHFYAFGRPK